MVSFRRDRILDFKEMRSFCFPRRVARRIRRFPSEGGWKSPVSRLAVLWGWEQLL